MKGNTIRTIKIRRLIALALTMMISCISLHAESVVSAQTKFIPEGYKPVYTIADLYGINSDMDGKYILMNDLDLSNNIYDTGSGWTPIGYSTGELKFFRGTFDGSGHKIKNLSINSTAEDKYSYYGLFSYCDKGSLICDLGLENVSISGECIYDYDNFHNAGAGAICGYNYGSINSCYATGTIKNTGVGYTGGIAGDNSYGIIQNCYTDVSVLGDSSGGICGENEYNDSCKNCYATGTAKDKENKDTNMICNYKSKECYYLHGNGTDKNAIPLTAGAMKSSASFTGFDFENTWYIDPNSSYPYPQLKSCPQSRATEISISSLPVKLEYETTDGKIDVTGGAIDVTYEGGGTTKGISITDEMCSYDFVAGEQIVTVSYAGQTATFVITVNKTIPAFTGKDQYTYYVDDSFVLDIKSDSPGDMAYDYDVDAGIVLITGGHVTCLKPGTITVTVVTAETDLYAAGEKKITINVLDGAGGQDPWEEDPDVIEIGDRFVRSGILYDISEQNGWRFARVIELDESAITVTIPNQVAYGGTTFDVAVICNNAFSYDRNLSSISIGNNVQEIGDGAFLNCKKLKSIYITATDLRSVGNNALKGINKKCKIYVPEIKLKEYKKMIKNKGQKKTVKVKAI